MAAEYDESSIRVIDSCDVIRIRLGLFFSYEFEAGNLNSFPLEMACHAIDEIVDGKCTQLHFQLKGHEFELVYNYGIGMRPEQFGNRRFEDIFTQLYVCSNTKKHLAVGDMWCRLGLRVVNAGCKWVEAESVYEGIRGKIRCEEGKLVSSEYEKVDPALPPRTRINALPDYQLLEGMQIDREGLEAKVARLAAEFPQADIRLLP